MIGVRGVRKRNFFQKVSLGLAAARSRSGSDTTPPLAAGCHSRPSRRFATLQKLLCKKEMVEGDQPKAPLCKGSCREATEGLSVCAPSKPFI